MFANLTLYLAFLGTSLALLIAGMAVYLQFTPYPELKLIREGNRAASISFGGTALGLAVALYAVGSQTFKVVELAAWGGVALLCQLLAFFVISRVLGRFKECIEQDKISYGVTLGAISLAIGILNAAALSS